MHVVVSDALEMSILTVLYMMFVHAFEIFFQNFMLHLFQGSVLRHQMQYQSR